MRLLVVVTLSLVLAQGVARGDIIGFFSPVLSENGQSPPPGFVTSDLAVQASTDWLAANLLVELVSGTLYQDALLTGIGPPSEALVNAIPSVQFDTYLTGSSGIAGGAPSTAGGAVDLGGNAAPAFGANAININWFTTSTADVGDFTLGRFTLSDDAAGTFALRLDTLGQPVPFLLSGTIEGGRFVAVPESGSISLLCASVLALVGAFLWGRIRRTRCEGEVRLNTAGCV